jgi:NADPH-dependent 2,4-dienoyl-CoA reductase/sulfur reductase-like enzyme/rhodanese-related sulfurtransferase
MDQHAEITIIQRSPELSMASCGYPYYVGGTVAERNDLISTPTGVVRDPAFYMNAKAIKALPGTEVVAVDTEAKTVSFRDLATDATGTTPYDKLIIATGATPVIPPVPGADLDGITTLQSMQDADYLRRIRDERKIKRAVVVGGGLIGVETCEALQEAGIDVTVVEMLPQLLKFLDWQLAKLVENHVKSKGATVITDNALAAFLGHDGRVNAVKLSDGTELPCELAVVAVGVKPNVNLARAAGIEVGALGGIKVNEYMETSVPGIYAAGDCVEVTNRLTGRPALAPYGDLANLQGRVAGQNAAVGNTATFPGTFHTGVCKVFDYAAGSTGLSEAQAAEAGLTNIVSVVTPGPDRPHFMGAKLLISKMVADGATGRILGYQCVGPGDVSKRVAVAAMALHGEQTVSDLVNADLPYAPPFSLALDHLIACAHVLENKIAGRLKGISAQAVKAKLDAGKDAFLLDVRGPAEFEQMRLGAGETLIPLGALRKRMGEIPEDKDREIICYCKISLRGYEAALILEANGWRNVKVMEGGIMAWPYPREK